MFPLLQSLSKVYTFTPQIKSKELYKEVRSGWVLGDVKLRTLKNVYPLGHKACRRTDSVYFDKWENFVNKSPGKVTIRKFSQ